MSAISPLAPERFPELPDIAGLELAACAAGIRYQGRPDLMLARLAPGTSMAGVFTRSSTRSPAVDWSAARIVARRASPTADAPVAILVNAGNANAFTGAAGLTAARAMAELAAGATGTTPDHALVASTGVIGEPLAVERIEAAMDPLRAGLGSGNWAAAAEAIRTTDTFPKGAAATAMVNGKEVCVAGIAKGSGMIAPNMATMLAFVFTDAAVAPDALQVMLQDAVEPTLNAITVDSDCSTSDSVLLGATGMAGNEPLTDGMGAAAESLRVALHQVLLALAHQIVRDGEGATKFVTIRVGGAADCGEAKRAAFAVANSPLVKTALAGEDPNWGRIVMALGKSGAQLNPDRLGICLGPITVTRAGAVAEEYAESAGAAYMRNAELEIGIDLGTAGTGSATVWTCDLTRRYVEINADYRS